MGHILFGAPPVARFHLHERLARSLTARGHRVTVLAADGASEAFHRAQGFEVWGLRPAATGSDLLAVDGWARRDATLAGRPDDARHVERRTLELQRLLPPLLRLFETRPPDLVLFHDGRSGLHRMLQQLAEEFGCHTLHTGAGMLPATMQWDPAGVDGDARACGRTAKDYREGFVDEGFLSAALSAWLARFLPPPLSRASVAPPSALSRLTALCGGLLRGDPAGGWRAAQLWRQALAAPPAPLDDGLPLPPPPFVTVLLQPESDPRVRLDAEPGTRPVDLVGAALQAARGIDDALPVVAVLPRRGLPPGEMARLREHQVAVRPAAAAQQAVSMALGVVTVNHPLGIAAILARTPLLHTGRTPYGIAGVTFRTTPDSLQRDLPLALDVAGSSLRERFLTRYLAVDHVWCAADSPDHNGLSGLVTGLESRVQHDGTSGKRLTYRVGPVWPLETLRAPS